MDDIVILDFHCNNGRLGCVFVDNCASFVQVGRVTILLYLAWWILCLEGMPGCPSHVQRGHRTLSNGLVRSWNISWCKISFFNVHCRCCMMANVDWWPFAHEQLWRKFVFVLRTNSAWVLDWGFGRGWCVWWDTRHRITTTVAVATSSFAEVCRVHLDERRSVRLMAGLGWLELLKVHVLCSALFVRSHDMVD